MFDVIKIDSRLTCVFLMLINNDTGFSFEKQAI